MAMNTFEINVDIKRGGKIPEPIVTQGDTVQLLLSITDDGVPFELTDVTKVSGTMTRKDGVIVPEVGEKLEGNVVKFTLSRAAINKVGPSLFKAQLYGLDGRVSTVSFAMKVLSDTTVDSYEPTDNELVRIEVVLEQGPKIIAEAKEAIVNTRIISDKALIESENAYNQAHRASNAADKADASAESANEVASTVSGVVESAETATSNANSSATNADESALLAKTAASLAGKSSDKADASATVANESADNADASAASANEAASEAKEQSDYVIENKPNIEKAITDSETALTTSEEVRTGFDKVIAEAGDGNPEITDARGGFGKLGQRLDDTTQRLADKAEQSEVRLKSAKNELEDMSPTVLSAIEGGEGAEFNLLSIPQDGSVTDEKIPLDTQKNVSRHAFKVAEEAVLNMLPSVNSGTLQPSNLEKLANKNGGVDGVVFEYIANEGSYPLTAKEVPYRIRQTYQRPTAEQYSRSTFELYFDASAEVDKDLYYSLMVRRSGIDEMANQVRFMFRILQFNATGTNVVNNELTLSKSEITTEGFELSSVLSNGIIGKLKILKVTDAWVAIGFKQLGGLLNDSIAMLGFRIGVYGIPISISGTLEYYNFVHSNQAVVYIDPFKNSPTSMGDLYGKRLMSVVDEAGEQVDLAPLENSINDIEGKLEDKNLEVSTINEVIEDVKKEMSDKRFLGNNYEREMETLSIFESGEWTGGVDNTSLKLMGDQTVKVTSDNGQFATLDKTGIMLDGNNKNFWLRCYIGNVEDLVDIELRFCADGDWNKRFIQIYSLVSGSGQYLQNGWNDLTGSIEGMSMYGVTKEDLDRIDSIRIRVRAKASLSTDVSFDILALFENPMNEGVVSITFDDGYRSLETEALPYMSKYNFRGTAYIFPEAIDGAPHFCTLDQVKKLDKAGWDISSHTYYHRDLTTIALDEVEMELKMSLDWLAKHGFQKGYEHFSYPRGGNSPEVREIVKKYFKTARISSGKGPFPLARLNSFPLINEYQINAIGIYPTTAKQDVYNAIDKAKETNQWCVLMYHGLLPDEGVTLDVNEFKDHMDYLYQSGIQVATLSEITADSKVIGHNEGKVDRKGYEDVEIDNAEKGFVLVDRVTGDKYRLYMEGGVIKSETTGENVDTEEHEVGVIE